MCSSCCSSHKQKLPECECVNALAFRMSLIYFSLSFHVTWQKLSPEKVYHVLVAPCFDKKLEAVREEFYNSLLETRDVDCVLTSGSLSFFFFSPPSFRHMPTHAYIFVYIGRGDVNKYESRLFNCVLQFVTLTVSVRKPFSVSFGCNTRKFLTSVPC